MKGVKFKIQPLAFSLCEFVVAGATGLWVPLWLLIAGRQALQAL